ncbi:MAG: POTRA domain-containing protein [Archangium sp.]|nr:POTRA domain-containing protein [Archangium sp.]
MRLAFAVLFLGGCATAPAVVKPAPVEAAPAALPALPVCPTGPVPFTESASVAGAMVEKVCLVGASEDGYLRMHELVAPREGAPLDAAEVRADLEALFSQGLLRDVVVVAQPLSSKGVMLSYVVTEYEWITQVDFTGVKAVKTDDFREIAHAGVRAAPFVIKTLTDTIEALYDGLGYTQAKVVATVKSLAGGNAALSLAVDEGPQVTVGEITIEGAQQVPLAELRKSLRSAVGAVFLQELVERDTLALTTLYFDHGMVNVAVVNTTRALPKGAVELVFQVKEGDVFRMGRVSLTGFALGAEKDVLKGIEAKPKSVFSRSALQRDMERIRARAKEKGFVVEITPLTTVDPEKKIIDVAFELEKRPSTRIQF